jgi:K+-transporting ATPase KdpF subunit
MLSILRLERACFLAPPPMCASANGCEAIMAEAFIGLIVAAGLAAYLVHALLYPEKY